MADRREAILNSALILLRKKGWSQTTVAEVARAAKVGVGTVYLEFDSKDAIMLELTGTTHRTILRRMRRAALRGEGFPERLEHIMKERTDAFMELPGETPRCKEVFACPCDGAEESRRRFEAEQHELLVDFLEAGQHAGAFARTHTAVTLADALLASFDALTPPGIFDLPQDKVYQRLEGILGLVLRGVLARGRSPQT